MARDQRRHIEWVPQWEGGDEPDETVWIDVDKVDRLWRFDGSFYIGRGGVGQSASPSRYARVGDWVTQRFGAMWMSLLVFEKGVVSFTDGRHRFAWMRDHGARALPVSVYPGDGERISRALGSKLKACRIFL
jgi:hypothetical protein